MKSSNIKAGVKATTKLNGRDQVVTVISQSLGKGGPTQWIVRTPAGNQVYRTARQLRAVTEPLNNPATLDDGIDAVEDRAHKLAMGEVSTPQRTTVDVLVHADRRGGGRAAILVKVWSGFDGDARAAAAVRRAHELGYTNAVA